MIPQSWHGKLEIDKTRGSGNLDAFLSLNSFFVVNLKT